MKPQRREGKEGSPGSQAPMPAHPGTAGPSRARGGLGVHTLGALQLRGGAPGGQTQAYLSWRSPDGQLGGGGGSGVANFPGSPFTRPALGMGPISKPPLERPHPKPKARLRARATVPSLLAMAAARRHSAPHGCPRRTSRLGLGSCALLDVITRRRCLHLLLLRGRSCWREWISSPGNGFPACPPAP